jgi:predicted dehydrogenase
MRAQAERPLRAAVVGVGHLGQYHAEKYARHPRAELVGVVDIDPERCEAVAQRLGVRAFARYEELIDQVHCVSIAVPTQQHYRIARDFLDRDVDVLVEKPLTATLDEGKGLVELAVRRECVLQVGHLERFNPAIRSLAGILASPRFIECHRLAPFGERGTDVDVVLDLMIHDLDVILSMVPSSVRAVEAVGVPVLSASVDIANARLRFANGCIANVTASRVSAKRERKIRIFQPDAYIAVDYDQRRVRVCRRVDDGGPGPSLSFEEHEVVGGDALADEIDAFLVAVAERQTPVVSGWDGLKALEVAHTILESMATEARAAQ